MAELEEQLKDDIQQSRDSALLKTKAAIKRWKEFKTEGLKHTGEPAKASLEGVVANILTQLEKVQDYLATSGNPADKDKIKEAISKATTACQSANEEADQLIEDIEKKVKGASLRDPLLDKAKDIQTVLGAISGRLKAAEAARQKLVDRLKAAEEARTPVAAPP